MSFLRSKDFMACYSPMQGYRSKFLTRNGKRKIVFNTNDALDTSKLFRVNVACGQCVGCRLEYSRQWAIRCMHESQMHSHNSFVTLTYNPKYLPKNSSLNYRDFSLFMKRLRKKFGSGIRYYMGPEYGEVNKRPHYHVLLFGVDFSDKKLFRVQNDYRLYRSDLLDSLWSDPKTGESMGFASVGSVTFESAAYVARYMMKKVKGDDSTNRYFTLDSETGELFQIEKEKARMSLKPGVGKEWFDMFKDDVFPHDYVILRGHKVRPPKYYDSLLEKISPASLELIKEARVSSAASYAPNNTPSRLEVRRIVKEKQLTQLIRVL